MKSETNTMLLPHFISSHQEEIHGLVQSWLKQQSNQYLDKHKGNQNYSNFPLF